MRSARFQLWLVVQYLYRSGCEPHDTGQNRTVPVPAPVTWVTRLNGRSYSTTAAAWVGEECDTHCMCCNQYILATLQFIKIQILCYYLALRGLIVYIYPIPHIHIPARELFFINMVATFQKDREVYKKLIMSDPYVKKILTEYKRMEANTKAWHEKCVVILSETTNYTRVVFFQFWFLRQATNYLKILLALTTLT